MNSTGFPNSTLASPPAAVRTSTDLGSKLAQSALILSVGVIAACARLLSSSPPRLPWCGERRFFQPKYVICEGAIILVTLLTIISSPLLYGADRKLLLQAIPVVAFPYVVVLNASMHGWWWKGLQNTVQMTRIGVGTATHRGLTLTAQIVLLLLSALGIALQAYYSDPVQAALNVVALITLQFGVHVNALQASSTQEGIALGKATIPTPCIGFKTRGYGVADGQLWQVSLVATQWSILSSWKDKLPKLRHLAAKGDFLAFVSEFTPLIQEAAERDGEGIVYDAATADAELASWAQTLLLTEAQKIGKAMDYNPNNPDLGRPCIDVWYALTVLERIGFKSDGIMHKPFPGADQPGASFRHYLLRNLCTYYNREVLDRLTEDEGLLTLQSVVPPAFLEAVKAGRVWSPEGEQTVEMVVTGTEIGFEAPGEVRTETRSVELALECTRAAYQSYPKGKWPDDDVLTRAQRQEGLALAKAYTSSIPCIMLTILEFLWVLEGESADRRAGSEKKGLSESAEGARVKQCILAQVVATQAVGMFYGVAVILGNSIFKGNGLTG